MMPMPGEPTAEAATTKKKKKTTGSRSDYTPEQRKKIAEWARNLCRKQYGSGARLHRIDYYTKRVWCYFG